MNSPRSVGAQYATGDMLSGELAPERMKKFSPE